MSPPHVLKPFGVYRISRDRHDPPGLALVLSVDPVVAVDIYDGDSSVPEAALGEQVPAKQAVASLDALSLQASKKASLAEADARRSRGEAARWETLAKLASLASPRT